MDERNLSLQNQLPKPITEVIERYLKDKKRGEYPLALRKFALTLSFYSLPAYEYVREVFEYKLPCINSLKNYYTVVDCRPGFTNESFEALKLIAKEILANQRKLL